MTAKIYLATKHAGTKHTYWVFDPDGNPYSGDEEVIRGGLPNDPYDLDYVIEAGRPIADSRDALNGDDPFADRYYTTVISDTLVNVQAVWTGMVSAAMALGDPISDPDFEGEGATKLSEGNYWIPVPDCHSLTATIGEAGGIDVLANLPKVGGDTGTGERTPALYYPGINGRLVSTGDDTVALEPSVKAYFDQGGADNYTLDPASLPVGRTIHIVEDSDTGTVDKITLQNIDPSDVHVVRGPHGILEIFIDGRNTPIILIEGQFDGSGIPKINTLVVIPPVGSPTSVPLVDPDNIPLYTPVPLPALIAGEIQPAFASAISAASPLVIDLSSAHSGVTLTTWNASTTETFFDLNDNGFAVQTAWVSGDTGLLARDLNSNGMIDSSAELFGSPTVDGFAKLAALDSNHDLRIDNNDSAWSSLVVWTDDNGDAVTQSGELHSLASLSIANIDLAGVASSTSTISGNPISHTSTVTFTGGATGAIADAWFVHDNTNSYYAGDYTLDAEALFLPTLRGYGILPDLTIAMSQDSDLKDLVTDFVGNFSLGDLIGSTTAITDILYTWAGVDGVNPISRGSNIDAQHLAFLEHLLGTEFVQTGSGDTPNPTALAGSELENAYQSALRMFSGALLIQSGFGQLFEAAPTYNSATGTITGDLSLSQDAIDDLSGLAPAPGPDNVEFWLTLAGILDGIKGLTNLTTNETNWLESAVNDSDGSLHWSAVLALFNNDGGTGSATGTSGADTINGGATNDTIHGLGGNDTIHGSYGNDMIYGEGGDNILYGDDGNDYVAGDSGNDQIYGGAGNDDLHGGYGNDIYYAGTGGNTIDSRTGDDTFVYGGGDDIITEYGGTDQIVLPSGIVLGDLTLTRVSSDGSTAYFDDLLIEIDGGGSIQIRNHFYNSSNAVETIVFYDTSTLSLSSLAPDVHLTAGNDNFYAGTNANYTVYGMDGNDTIYTAGTGAHTIDGGNGNDVLRAGTNSNDTYIASTGFDRIEENGGTDTIVISEEYDSSDVSFYRIGSYDLGISITGLGQIQIVNQLSYIGGVESLHFDSDNSTINLTDITVATIGTSGNDSLTVPSYNTNHDDFIDGREGNDSLYGADGDDTYVFSAGHDTINEGGSGGNDTIHVRELYTHSDVSLFFDANSDLQLIDIDGNNITVYRQGYAANYGVEYVVFADSTTWNLTSMEVETHGTSSNDYLYGSSYGDASNADTIYGYAGADSIYGGNGNDLIYGGDGDDSLRGEAGDDTIYGGDGDDNIYISGSGGNDTVHGDAGADTIYGTEHSVLYGDDGNDTLYNNASTATGTLVTLFGGDGADVLWGGVGQAVMDGGGGADTLNGSAGSTETFKFGSDAFGSVDTINQFRTNDNDKLDISDILDGHYNPLTDVITNFVQITTSGSNSELFVDTTGSATFGASQHIATIQSVTGLTDEAALVTAGLLVAA